MTPPYRVGVIGAGLKGTQHARAYQLDPRTEVVAVAEKDPDALELFQRRFGLERGYTDYREMLSQRADRHCRADPAIHRHPGGRHGVGRGRRQGRLLREADVRHAGRGRPHGRSLRIERRPLRLRRRGAQLRRPLGRASRHRVGRDRRCPVVQDVRRSGRNMGRRMPVPQRDADVRVGLRGGLAYRLGRDRPMAEQRPGHGGQHPLRERHRRLHLHEAGRREGHGSPVREGLPVLRLAPGPHLSSTVHQATKNSSSIRQASTSAPTSTRTAG